MLAHVRGIKDGQYPYPLCVYAGDAIRHLGGIIGAIVADNNGLSKLKQI